jgi:hypothetical protein
MTAVENAAHKVLKQAEGKDNEVDGHMVCDLDAAEEARKGVSTVMVLEVEEAVEEKYKCRVVFEEAPVDPGEDHRRKVEDKG